MDWKWEDMYRGHTENPVQVIPKNIKINNPPEKITPKIDYNKELDKYSKDHFLPELQIQEKLWFINDSQASVLKWLTTADAINDGLVWLKANNTVQEAIRNPTQAWITENQKIELIKLTDPKNYKMWVLYDAIFVREQLSKMYLTNLLKEDITK